MRSTSGQLYVFEGPDGVGKSELSRRLAQQLAASGVNCEHLAFPGWDEGTLGKHVYELHHHAQRFGIERLSPTSLQLLHIAAHIDTIEHRILPALQAGLTVVLDRFWWSTIVYGMVSGVNRPALDGMIGLELTVWGSVQPTAIFLVRRSQPLRPEPMDQWRRWCDVYEKLAAEQTQKYPVHIIDNSGSIDGAMDAVVRALSSSVAGSQSSSREYGNQLALTFDHTKSPVRAPATFSALSPARPTVVFDSYWRFAAERQAIFFKRFAKLPPPWTYDPILQEYKFTNAYRASDRVSQFLIKHVIYEGDQSPEEVFFRTILFKLFNKIETWQLLTEKLGPIRYTDYSFDRYDRVLSSAITHGQRIYSAAYIMPSGNGMFGATRKHRAHLKLLERMMGDELPYRIAEARSMFAAFKLLRSYPMIGDFLAYQYVTDLNYSTLSDFSEMEFVVPGPGARAGIHKCFEALGGLNESDIIKVVTDRQQAEFKRLGLEFESLWGRPLQLIDCQSLFCEVDKYARIKHPEIVGISGRTRIKQKFRQNLSDVDYWYPPKWGLNEKIASSTLALSYGERGQHSCIGSCHMNFRQYQLEASKTDQVPGSDDKSIVVPLLGLAGEAGSLLTEYKKRLRDGESYRVFKERISEELGDILWYVANIAAKAELNLEEVAQGNLMKVRERWSSGEDTEASQRRGARLFDEEFPSHEQLPRHFEVNLRQITDGESVKVVLTLNGEKLGDHLTDNAYDDDGYRFHDVFHLGYAAILGWSPLTRKLMKRKRKSVLKVDEVEDGGRAIVIEEAISAVVFGYAQGCSFFEGVDTMDYSLLRTIKNLTSHLEASRCSTGEWERAILEGYRVWRRIREEKKGIIVGDLVSRTIEYRPCE